MMLMMTMWESVRFACVAEGFFVDARFCLGLFLGSLSDSFHRCSPALGLFGCFRICQLKGEKKKNPQLCLIFRGNSQLFCQNSEEAGDPETQMHLQEARCFPTPLPAPLWSPPLHPVCTRGSQSGSSLSALDSAGEVILMGP